MSEVLGEASSPVAAKKARRDRKKRWKALFDLLALFKQSKVDINNAFAKFRIPGPQTESRWVSVMGAYLSLTPKEDGVLKAVFRTFTEVCLHRRCTSTSAEQVWLNYLRFRVPKRD